MITRRTCLNCAHCPNWKPENDSARCELRFNDSQKKDMGFPKGTQIVPPWISKESVKTNCPAWTQQPGGDQ